MAEKVKKELHHHAKSFIETQKHAHATSGGRHGHPNPGKEEFAAFVESQKKHLLDVNKNPAAWERLKPELDDALNSFE